MAMVLLSPLTTFAADPPEPTSKAQPVKSFAVLEYRVEGNTLLHAIDIERAVTPYLGEAKTINDVEAARKDLEKLYHDHGYQTVLVNIPQQEIGSGIVRLSVVEAAVGQMQIKGSRYHSLQVISATVPELKGGVIPDFNEVQKELAQVNHTQDLHVTPVLRASATPGQVDVDLDVHDELPLHATIEANNRYSANTSQLRLIGGVDYDNLFQSNQSLSVQYQVAPEEPANAKIWSVSYVIPMPDGLVLALYGVRSDSNIAAVGAVDVIGNGSIYGLRLIDPLPSARNDFYHNFTAGFDYKDFKQDVTLQGSDDLPSPARYSVVFAALHRDLARSRGSASRRCGDRGRTQQHDTRLRESFTITALGFDNPAQFDHKRFGASADFFVLQPSLQRQQILPWNWSLAAALGGQLASGPLISNERYAGGGLDSVRGYTEAERLGDNGARGSLELRTPQLLEGRSRFTNSYCYLFADAARVRDPRPVTCAANRISPRQRGGGISLQVRRTAR